MIDVLGVTYAYRNHQALEDLRVRLTGNRVGLLGPNGAGKSTLIRLITTLLPLQQGVITVDGVDLTSNGGAREVRARLGYVPQQMGLPAGYTGEEFLAYAAWMRQVRTPGEAVARALDTVGLLERRSSRIKSLSGGMRQRLCIAQALVHRPSLLIVDEPSVGLDPQQRANLRALLRELDCQVVLATHLVDDIAGVADQVIVLDHGRARFSGSTREFCRGGPVSAETVERAYLACVSAEAA